MKLTKAQRLFVEVGHVEYLAQRIAYLINATRPNHRSHWTPGKIGLLRVETGKLKRLRARRKRLIREALESWQEEEKIAYDEGMGLAMRAFRKWMGDAAQCINKTTKTQHT